MKTPATLACSTVIASALMFAAYGDIDLLEDLFDSDDTEIKALGGALKAVAGRWATMRSAARGLGWPAASRGPSVRGFSVDIGLGGSIIVTAGRPASAPSVSWTSEGVSGTAASIEEAATAARAASPASAADRSSSVRGARWSA